MKILSSNYSHHKIENILFCLLKYTQHESNCLYNHHFSELNTHPGESCFRIF